MTKLILFASLLLNFSVAFARTDSTNQFQGRVASEAEVVQYLSKYVYELKRPYMVFHWFDATNRNALWKSPISAYDYAGYNYVRNQGSRFFQSYCSTQNSSLNPDDCSPASTPNYGMNNMYGPGFYAAQNPMETYSFGGGPGNAVLIQIQLPKGFKTLDLVKDTPLFPSEISNYFQNEQCPYFSSLSALVQLPSGYGDRDQCKLAVRRVLKDKLNIEGFFYDYGNFLSISGCNSDALVPPSSETAAIGNYRGPFGQRALVLTSTGRISPSNVRIFNSQTPDAKTDRITLDAIFKLMSGRIYSGYLRLTWSDVPSNDTNPNVVDWLKENVMGCKAEVPYGPTR